MYWADEANLNERDLILRRLAPDLRQLVTSRFRPLSTNPAERRGTFDIVLGPDGRFRATPFID